MKQIIVICLTTFVLGINTLWGASANITKVDGDRVEIDIGSSRGIVVGMTADVLSDAGRVVHPVTGEDYGPRKVKIAEMMILSVDAESAVGRLIVVYAPVNAGDIADGLIAIPSPEERMQMDIDEARAEIKALARDLADEINGNKKAIDDLRRTLTRIGSSERRLQSVMNSVQNMRERMVVMQNRMEQIEEYQSRIDNDSSEVATKMRIDEIEVRMEKLEAQQEEMTVMANQTVAMRDSGQAEMAAPNLDEPIDDLFNDEEAEPEETPWYTSMWFLGGVGALFIGLVAGAVILFLKKKQGGGDEAAEDINDLPDDDMADDTFEVVEDDDMVEELPDDLPELEDIVEEES